MALILIVIALGIIEGLTEYIPVSSTGHLILANKLFGFEGQVADTFDIFIQLGAILAVVFLYFGRFKALLDFKSSTITQQNGLKGLNGIIKLGLTCLPAFVIGGLFHHQIKEKLFFPGPVAAALIFGGVAMILIERYWKKHNVTSVEQITLKHCLGIGFFQCLAMWPGMSRSASTIIGGMLFGLERGVAAEFSFLVAVPTMCAAVGYDMLKSIHILHSSDILYFAIGFVVSFVVAVYSIKFFIGILNKITLAPFGWYRIALGALVLWLVR
jgi:undecaprenyl-diphosphatase